jgi:hypothetical protein
MISLADALHLVHKEAFMIKANADVPFGMSAIYRFGGRSSYSNLRQASVVGLVEAVNLTLQCKLLFRERKKVFCERVNSED